MQTDTVKTMSQYDLKKMIRDSLVRVYRNELYAKNQNKANRVTTFYVLAQQKFYNNEFREALSLINVAEKTMPTSDVLALKGSIYLGLGSIEEFTNYWRQALTLDSKVPIPPSPAVVEELKRQGLINENLERNF